MSVPEGLVAISDVPEGLVSVEDPIPTGLVPYDEPDYLKVDLFQGQGMGGGTSWTPPTLDENISVLREFGHGASLGTSDDIEAFLRGTLSGRGFKDQFQEIQEERDKFKEENPGTALGLEVLGGFTTGGVLGRAVGLGNSLLNTTARQALAGAAEAGTYGFFSEDEVADRVKTMGLGVLLGGVLGGGSGALAHALQPQAYGAMSEKTLRELRKAVKGIPISEQTDIVRSRVAQRALDTKLRGTKNDGTFPSPLKAAQEATEELGLDFKEVLAQANKSGGFVDYRDVSARELVEAITETGGFIPRSPQEAAKVAKRSGRGTKAMMDSAFAPIKRMMTNQVGVRFASLHNRAQNRALMQLADFHDNYSTKIEPIKAFLDSESDDALYLSERLLNGALGEAGDYAEAVEFIGRKFGKQLQKDFLAYMDQVHKFSNRYGYSIDSTMPITDGWLHTQKKAVRTEGALRPSTSPNTYTDVSQMQRTRKVILDDPDLVREYENPLRSMDDWIDDHTAAINVAELFHLRPAGRIDQLPRPKGWEKAGPKRRKAWEADALARDKSVLRSARGGFIGQSMKERLKQEGYDTASINNAIELTHAVLYDSQRAPTQIIRSLRDLGYMGTIMNPYGAALNVHDVLNAASKMGVRNALSTVFRKAELPAEDVGIAMQDVGEYIKRASTLAPNKIEKVLGFTDGLTHKFAKWSGFRSLDKWGKERILQMSLNEARKAVTKGDFDEVWKHTFTAQERLQIKQSLAKGETSDLVKELAMFRLSQIQPINAAQSTKFALNNPNARLFYMLKNYAIRQLDFLRENGLEEWKRGNRASAVGFLARYALFSGGGYAAIQEARQPLAGRSPDFSPEKLAINAGRQMASVATVGIAGTSDYAWEKFWQNPVEAAATGILPPTNLIEATWKDAYNLITDGEPPKEVLMNLPVVGKTFFTPLLKEED